MKKIYIIAYTGKHGHEPFGVESAYFSSEKLASQFFENNPNYTQMSALEEIELDKGVHIGFPVCDEL